MWKRKLPFESLIYIESAIESPPTTTSIESFTRDPIDFIGSQWGLYEVFNGRVLDDLDPTGLIPISCECRIGPRFGIHFNHIVEIDCPGLASNCCRDACCPDPNSDFGCNAFTGKWSVAGAKDDLEDPDPIDDIETVVCGFFLICDLVTAPIPGDGVACAVGTKVVCKTIKKCTKVKKPKKQKTPKCKSGTWRVGNCGRNGPVVEGCPGFSPFAIGNSRGEAQRLSLQRLPEGCNSPPASYHHCTAHECVKGKWERRMSGS